ncbi:MAG: helix-turn-helix domain-containing protein [Terriglobales bacterium]
MTPGSGNVFADLGLPRPEEELTKAQLASAIRQTIRTRRLTQSAGARAMGVDRPKVSALFNGRLGNFSSERLLKMLTRLGLDVEIRLTPRCRERVGQIRVIRVA